MPTQAAGAAVIAPAFSPAAKAKVQIRLATSVNLENITEIIKGIGGHYGCLTCGLGGIDLTLSGDPVEVTTFSKLPGVQAVSFQ